MCGFYFLLKSTNLEIFSCKSRPRITPTTEKHTFWPSFFLSIIESFFRFTTAKRFGARENLTQLWFLPYFDVF